MSQREHRRALVRVGIYLVALVLVLMLFLQRNALLPLYDLRISQVRETAQLGSLVAGEGEKLVVVQVQLVVPVEILGRLRPSLFALLDTDGREHRPDALSPLFSHTLPLGQTRGIEGILVFRLPEEAMGTSLSFNPEVEDIAPNLKSEDIGSKVRP
jgi:hypothetical protein